MYNERIIIIQIQHDNKELWPRHVFGFVLTLTLTITDMTLLLVITYPRFMDNYCYYIIQIQHGSKELCLDMEFASSW